MYIILLDDIFVMYKEYKKELIHQYGSVIKSQQLYTNNIFSEIHILNVEVDDIFQFEMVMGHCVDLRNQQQLPVSVVCCHFYMYINLSNVCLGVLSRMVSIHLLKV